MSTEKQTDLRQEMISSVLRAVEADEVTLIEAAVACMGTAAVVLGTFPLEAREQLALALEGKLLEHANRRAREIRGGEFDREMVAH